MNNKLTGKALAYPYIIWIIICTVLPFLFIIFYGFTTDLGTFTLENIIAIADPVNLKALWLSLEVAFITTIICLILSYPVALILNALHVKSKSFVVFIFILPMWMNFMLRILAWQVILSNNGLINHVLGFFGLPALHMLYTQGAVVLGTVYDFLPFMILPIYNSLSKVGDDVVEAALDLGANRFQVFTRVILPLTKNGILSGIIMVFVPALSSFVISNLLGGGKVLLIGNIIEMEFNLSRNWNLGSGLSIVLMIFVLLSMSLMNKTGEDGQEVLF